MTENYENRVSKIKLICTISSVSKDEYANKINHIHTKYSSMQILEHFRISIFKWQQK